MVTRSIVRYMEAWSATLIVLKYLNNNNITIQFIVVKNKHLWKEKNSLRPTKIDLLFLRHWHIPFFSPASINLFKESCP